MNLGRPLYCARSPNTMNRIRPDRFLLKGQKQSFELMQFAGISVYLGFVQLTDENLSKVKCFRLAKVVLRNPLRRASQAKVRKAPKYGTFGYFWLVPSRKESKHA
jgi:hypothetical protein